MADPSRTFRDRFSRLWRATRGRIRRALVVIRARVPFGLRTLLGLLLMAGGVLGALPVLGFWMLPLGVAVIALDVAELGRSRRSRRRDGRDRKNRT